jgi:phenylalanyl-tRNA synthetase beta chain
MAEHGVSLGLRYMAEWSGGSIAPDLVDAYPLPPKDSVVDVTSHDVKRLLGIDLTLGQIAELLTRLEFKCEVKGNALQVTAPPHRMDIDEGVVGLADVLEEVARSYGYDNIPTTSIADALPPQVGNPIHEWEEHLRDLLVALGLQEVVSYRMTSVEKESRVIKYDDYVRIANPTTPDKSVLRRSLVASVLDALERNMRLGESLSLFEVGSIFEPVKNDLPNEWRKLAIAMTGLREATAWDVKASAKMDFYDLKGRLELLLSGLRLTGITYTETFSTSYLHPGKSAAININGKVVGVFGELHPLVKEGYVFGDAPVLVAEFDLETLRHVNPTYGIVPVSEFPPVYEDIAVIVADSVAASAVEALIKQTGGKTVTNVKLFDVYRDEKIGAGKKSLAYSLTYQAEKTLTDAEAAAIRNKIVKRLEHEFGAKLRS